MKKTIKRLLLLNLLFTIFIFASFDSILKKPKFLTPDEAFQVTAVKQDNSILTKIKIADKIHVYDDESFIYRVTSPSLLELDIKRPVSHDYDGDKVFEKEIVVIIPIEDITSKVSGDYTLEIELLGCSDRGICYQPFIKSFNFKGKEAGIFDKISSLTKEGNTAKIADVLGSESSFFIILLFFIFGLLLALTPCIFPMIPILSSIIVSQAGNEKPSVAKAFFTSLVYVVSMALTYTVVGVVAGLLGADIQSAMQNPWVLTIFAAMFIALAFSLFGYYEIGLPASWQSKISKASDDAKGKGILGTAIMGLLSALIVGPCVAPPLGGAVLFISHTGDALLGGVALFVMSMGMGVPLLLVGIGAGKFMPRPGGWMTVVSEVFGVMMLGLAIFMLSRIVPDFLTMILWALLFMGSALYMGLFDQSSSRVGMKKLFQLLAMVFFLYGASLFVGALSGATSTFKPFEKFTQIGSGIASHSLEIKSDHRGYSVSRLMDEVKASKKLVVVDFGKDSCTACTELELITFPDQKVQEELKNFTFIKIDLTNNSDDDKELLKKFELFGTPNIIFFNKKNKFLPKKSLTGFIEPEVFAEHLKSI
ncbi:MAG: thiol:disulfide interchange protein [Epsilonproteobacteria bacterium]|nr:MAG: thiol:disulfide interchange protein [Campylobacterota bacterium]